MAQQLVSRILLQLEFPKDSGPVYTETLPGSFPVEPFNTFSNIIFLAIVIYFGVKIYNSNQTHKFRKTATPLKNEIPHILFPSIQFLYDINS